MSQIALVVTLECRAESREALIQALLAHRDRCLSQEPGTLQFEVMVPNEPGTPNILLFERYRDAEALALHAQGESLARFRTEVGTLITHAISRECTRVGASIN